MGLRMNRGGSLLILSMLFVIFIGNSEHHVYLSRSLPPLRLQKSKQSPDNIFEEKVEKYKADLIKLIEKKVTDNDPFARVRQIQELPTLSAKNIIKALQQDYPPETAMLFYSYEEPEFQIWLLDQSGIKPPVAYKIKSDRLEEAISNIRIALNIDSLQRDRAPRLRAAVVGKIRKYLRR